MRKDVKQFIRGLVKRGWYFKRTAGTGHIIMFYRPGGYITVPVTPSDHRWEQNCEHDARRVEKKYGEWISLEEKKASDEYGLDYQKPILEECEVQESTIEAPVLPEPIIVTM